MFAFAEKARASEDRAQTTQRSDDEMQYCACPARQNFEFLSPVSSTEGGNGAQGQKHRTGGADPVRTSDFTACRKAKKTRFAFAIVCVCVCVCVRVRTSSGLVWAEVDVLLGGENRRAGQGGTDFYHVSTQDTDHKCSLCIACKVPQRGRREKPMISHGSTMRVTWRERMYMYLKCKRHESLECRAVIALICGSEGVLHERTDGWLNALHSTCEVDRRAIGQIGKGNKAT
ncbi:uncharacterized protein MEPE_00434 [Melanopsichium pennsylvanicum]|uniref:Uncharacterized protein n=1 Tax=Melanopsichium pennsylvanicum TaxID=63383 RepID=A0AAJ4XFV9_9BASI|nr:uncharacterized protein MEPE_00434 [Melanopsichium pennsylvanicum]